MTESLPQGSHDNNTRFSGILEQSEHSYSKFLFDTLRTAVVYLDQWGRIRSANNMANHLFDAENLSGKTILEVLNCWDNPLQVHQEIMKVIRTGDSIVGQEEKVLINGEIQWFQTDKIFVQDASHGFKGIVFTLDNISLLKQQQLNLAKNEASYRAFVESSQDAIWRIDLIPPINLDEYKTATTEEYIDSIVQRSVIGDCNYIFKNIYKGEAFNRLNGLLLKDIPFLESILDVPLFVKNNFQIQEKNAQFINQETSEKRYLKISAQGIIEDNHLVSIWGVTKDVTDRQVYIEQLEYQNSHDLLTGLPNRLALQTTVEKSLEQIDVDKSHALMIIDLDSFKEVNDTLGHDVGDKILQQLCPRILQKLNDTPSFFARLGGDEFAVLLTNISDSKVAIEVAQSLLLAIRQYFYFDGIEVELRASIGISLYPAQAETYSGLMRFADVAMYCAKKNMSGFALYDSMQDAHSPKRLTLMSELGKAIRNDELCLYYQPKISLNDKHLVGVEALSRWIHPTMGFISPAEFVPIAEMTDLINEMTNWVLKESLRQLSEWRKKSIFLSMAVNISARNLLQDNFCDYVLSALEQYDIPPGCLELEITETTLMKNTEKTLNVLKRLDDIGVELSIDDFGTGYSSLAYLKRLPVKRLKIDYSFVINMLENEQDRVIVNSTINMAHNLGLLVVAEGVENKNVLQSLSDMRCEQAQGFHIAKPMPAKEFQQWCQAYF